MNPLSTPRRTSPLVALFGIAEPDRLRTALPVVVVAFGSGRFVPVIVVAAAIGVLAGVLGWYRRLWWFDGAVLHLDEGVIVRNQRRIPVERIQHVELERRLRHQLFGLAAVRIETAGGSAAELRLDAVRDAEAESLRRAVRAAVDARPVVDQPVGDDPGRAAEVPAPAEVLVRLPPTRLLLAGITGPEVVAVFTALAIGFDALADLGVDPEQLDAVRIGDALAVLLGIVAVPAWFLTAGLIAVVRKWNLTATARGDELHVTYGLLRRQEFVMRTGRVQDVRIAHRLLLRPFGRGDLRVRSGASGSGESSRIDVPLLDAAETERVLARILRPAVPRPELHPAPTGAKRRALVRGAMGGTAVGSAVAALSLAAGAPVVGVVLIAALGPGAGTLWGGAWYRGLGWVERDGVHHSRSGALTRHTAMVPEARVQSAAVVSSWFQRRRGLASVRLDLAAGRVHVVDRALDEARRIAASVTAHPGGRDDGRPRGAARGAGC